MAFLCNSGFALQTLYRGLFTHLRSRGFECVAVAGDDSVLGDRRVLDGVEVHVIPMERAPAPFKDLMSLFRLIAFFAKHRFDVVHVSTPKAAFLGAIAARLTGHSRILFVVRAQVYKNRTGVQRWIYEHIDWLVSRLSTAVAPISREMGAFMVARGLCPPGKIRYFGGGSSNGVNVRHFSRTEARLEEARHLRAEHGIPDDALLMLYVGRLAHDKGIHHLPAVLDRASGSTRPVWLLVVGPVDNREPLGEAVLADLDGRSNVVRLGYYPDPAPLYAAADLFLFPTYREGFGNVAIEAQAMEVPVVGFDTQGVREAVDNGRTGLLVPLGDGDAFAEAAVGLLEDEELRLRMAADGAHRVRSAFSNEHVWGDLEATLKELAPSKSRSRELAA